MLLCSESLEQRLGFGLLKHKSHQQPLDVAPDHTFKKSSGFCQGSFTMQTLADKPPPLTGIIVGILVLHQGCLSGVYIPGKEY